MVIVMGVRWIPRSIRISHHPSDGAIPTAVAHHLRYLTACASIDSFIHSTISSILPFTHPSHLFIHPTIYPFIYSSIHPFIHKSIFSFIHLSIHLFIHPPIFSSIYSSMVLICNMCMCMYPLQQRYYRS
jgi:hypothetical protein